MTKKSLLALLLVAAMLLSGCSLVVKDKDVDALQTIIDVNGEIINKQTFEAAFAYQLSMEQYYAQIYAMYLGQSSDVDEAQVKENTLTSYVTSLVKNQKSVELGLDKLTDEETARAEETAQADYQTQLDSIKSYYFADSQLEEAELAAQVEAYAADMGYTMDSMRASAQAALITEKLEGYVKDPVTVDDSDLQAALDEKIAAEKTSYETNLAAYGSAVNAGTPVFYAPEGYRTVRVIEIAKPEDAAPEAAGEPETDGAADDSTTDAQSHDGDAMTATGDTLTNETESADTADAGAAQPQANAALDAANALHDRLAAGDNFDALELAQQTYVLCASSTDVDAALLAAAMALETPGAYSPVTETATGYAIALYDSPVEPGAATLDTARDTLYNEVLTAKQNAAFDAAVAQWEAAADIKVYRDRLD